MVRMGIAMVEEATDIVMVVGDMATATEEAKNTTITKKQNNTREKINRQWSKMGFIMKSWRQNLLVISWHHLLTWLSKLPLPHRWEGSKNEQNESKWF